VRRQVELTVAATNVPNVEMNVPLPSKFWTRWFTPSAT